MSAAAAEGRSRKFGVSSRQETTVLYSQLELCWEQGGTYAPKSFYSGFEYWLLGG
jgi:hypothetical protein